MRRKIIQNATAGSSNNTAKLTNQQINIMFPIVTPLEKHRMWGQRLEPLPAWTHGWGWRSGRMLPCLLEVNGGATDRRQAWKRERLVGASLGKWVATDRWRILASLDQRLIPEKSLRWLIRLKRIYNFWCSMLVFTPFALCFVTLLGVFMHFLELTY
jgi:hypothetical protein